MKKLASLPGFLPGFLSGFLLLCAAASAGDWPTYKHDFQRSGVTEETLSLPLTEAWVYTSRLAPRPAWEGGPAKQNFWWGLSGLKPKVTYDRAYHAAVAGGLLYFGSSADDQVHCLDAATGRERWRFFTGGPVRLAPSLHEGRLYAGSDDGCVYCLDASKGALVWKYRPGPKDRRILGNSRMISRWPIRTGMIVEGDIAYFGAGLFPKEEVYLCAVDAGTGKERWKTVSSLSLQGYPLSSRSRLYIPTGRTTPTVFGKNKGEPLGDVAGEGGAYALITDELLIHGPGHTGSLELFDTETNDKLATFKGHQVIVTAARTYLHTGKSLMALDRVRYVALARERLMNSQRQGRIEETVKNLGKDKGKKAKELDGELATIKAELDRIQGELEACLLWKTSSAHHYSLILAGEHLFAGGDGEVAAFNGPDGALIWTGAVSGAAYGLAVSDGRLFASTDAGTIHAFHGAPEQNRPEQNRPE